MIKKYGEIGLIDKLINKIKIKKGYVLVGCSMGMIKELKGMLKWVN